MPTVLSKPLPWFKDVPQVRQEFDEDEIRQIGESMKAHGQIQPVLARSDGTLIIGGKRLRGAKSAGLPTLNVIIADDSLSETQITVIQLIENLHRSDLRDSEKCRAFEKLVRLNPDWSHKDLAAHLKLSESTVTKYQAASRCIPEVQDALAAGKLGITAVYEISRVAADQQAELLRLKLSGTSRDGLAEHVRKQRAAATPAVRVSKIKCPLPSGQVITVSGHELSLDEAIDALKEAIKAMTKARDTGLNSATAQRVWADVAKTG
jgi:ParB family chromosome partitioning protein